MDNLIIYGSNKEGTDKYLLSLVEQNFDASFVKTLKSKSIVIVLPNTVDSLKEKYKDNESALVDDLNRIDNDIANSDVVINLDVAISSHYSFYNMISSRLYSVPINCEETRRKPRIAMLKRNTTTGLHTNHMAHKVVLNKTAILVPYTDLKDRNISHSQTELYLYNTAFRFDHNNDRLQSIKQPVEALGICLKYHSKLVFVGNFKEIDYKNFFDIFSLIKKIA